MLRISKRIFFGWLFVVIWMCLIFFLSHQPASESSELSQGITNIIFEVFESITSHLEIDMQFSHYLIRKSAHFFAYFVLGLLVMNALRPKQMNNFRSVLLTMVICIIYAISDEVHQLFIPGRSGEITDVIIDSIGSTVGIGVYLLIAKFIMRNS